MSLTEPVPRPPLKPLVGNLTERQSGCPNQNLVGFARTYGPFFKLTIMDSDVHVASSQERLDELCGETRFDKRVQGGAWRNSGRLPATGNTWRRPCARRR